MRIWRDFWRGQRWGFESDRNLLRQKLHRAENQTSKRALSQIEVGGADIDQYASLFTQTKGLAFTEKFNTT